MRYLLFLYLLFQIDPVHSQVAPEVMHAGALRNMMQLGITKAFVSLDTLQKEDLYALGAITNLKGEILVIDGSAKRSFVENGKLKSADDYNSTATLLVYSYVEQWKPIAFEEDSLNFRELELWLEEMAASEGLDINKPFPFIIEGTFPVIDWHVIDWPDGDKVHSHEKHRNSGIRDALQEDQGYLLGFFSKNHKGIFTHHSTFLHMHFLSGSLGAAVHVDDLVVGSEVKIYLPSQ